MIYNDAMQVTARELKLRLGRYLEAVHRGQTLRITRRGKAIAEIRPLASTATDALAQLVAQGLATPGSGRLPSHTPVAAERSASGLVLAERDPEHP